MFERFQLDNIVRNKELLRSFSFEVIYEGGVHFLKIEKTSGNQPLKFILPLDSDYTKFWNLLKQYFFPSSVSILTKLGKRFSDSYYGEFERMLGDMTSRSSNSYPSHNFFRDSRVEVTVLRFFRYKNISFDGNTGSPYLRTKSSVNIRSQHKHVLIDYFRKTVTQCLYEKSVFDAIVKLFDVVEEGESIDDLLEILSLSDNNLILKSLFSANENGVLHPINYGLALHASCQGNPILRGDVPWQDFIKNSSNFNDLLEEVNLSLPYQTQVSTMETLAQNTRRDVLTREASQNYNEETPQLCYWTA